MQLLCKLLTAPFSGTHPSGTCCILPIQLREVKLSQSQFHASSCKVARISVTMSTYLSLPAKPQRHTYNIVHEHERHKVALLLSFATFLQADCYLVMSQREILLASAMSCGVVIHCCWRLVLSTAGAPAWRRQALKLTCLSLLIMLRTLNQYCRDMQASVHVCMYIVLCGSNAVCA